MIDSPISPFEAQQYAPLTLAYLGDAVFELLVRRYLTKQGNRPNGLLHKKALGFVCASAQSRAMDFLEAELTEDEVAIYRRGKNSNAVGGKNSDAMEYKRATGLEAVFGYLYLTGQTERITTLFQTIVSRSGK